MLRAGPKPGDQAPKVRPGFDPGANHWITVSTPDAPGGKYDHYAYARKDKNPVDLEMPATPGNFEIRYVANPEARVLAKIPIVITEAKATVDTHEKVVAGAELEVDWTGPGGGSDRILLVPADQAANDDAVKSWRTDRGTPARLLSPETPANTKCATPIALGKPWPGKR